MEEKSTKLTPQQLVKILSDNNREEQGAISGYLSLLEKISISGVIGNFDYQEVTNAVREIIADEMNHMAKLSALITKYSGIQPKAD